MKNGESKRVVLNVTSRSKIGRLARKAILLGAAPPGPDFAGLTAYQDAVRELGDQVARELRRAGLR